jgi:RsiW-degrading membrane proteinase PrsW (M82 family)
LCEGDKLRKHKLEGRWKVALALSLLFFLPIAVETVNIAGIPKRDYSVLGAPPLEEAFKGALLWLWLSFILYRISSKALARKGARNLWFLGGYLVGLTFGIAEDFPSVLGALSSLATHAPWTGAVGAGIYLAQAKGRRSLLGSLYLTAVGAHMAWNSGVYMVSPLLFSLSLALTSAAILVSLSAPSHKKRGA